MTVHYQIRGATAAEISASVEAGVRGGELAPAAALPPVRVLAAGLGVSPGTAAAAYRQLRERGVVETAGRAGTRVRPRPPITPRLSRRPRVPDGLLDLSAGEPDLRLLPPIDAALRAVAAAAPAAVGYRDGGPLPELLELARDRLAADRLAVPTGGVTVTAGALDAIERVLAAHLRPGDRVAVEDPGWANLLDLVAALGLAPVPVPVDDDGPTEVGLRAALRGGARAVVVTARAHNPTGAAVTRSRAAVLRGVLRGYPQVLLIEDDHAAELAGVALHPLAGSTRAWVFVRSVAKPYGPDLRLAVVAGDEATISRVEGRLRLGAGWVSTVLQRVVLELWRSDEVAGLVARAGRGYAQRREELLASLHRHGVAARGRTGINIWVPVADETAAVATLRDEGYAVAPGALYRIAAPAGIRVTVSPLDPGQLGPLAEALARAAQPRTGRPSA